MRWLALPWLVALGCSWGDDIQQPATHTVSLAMDSFAVAPGQEVWKCQDFANPFGSDVQVVRWRSHMSRGSHHLLVSLRAGAVDTAVTDCTEANLDGQVFDSQGLDSETAYPDGIAFQVPAGSGFRLEAHYLNAEDAAFDGAVTMEAEVDDSGEPLIAAGPLVFTTNNITIPPATDTTITRTCTVAHDLSLFDAVSHMHKRGTHFVASVGSQVLYETYTYDHPPRSTFATPIELHAGDVVTYSCSYRNTGTTTITFGQSADTDEMCALFGSYYPVPDGAEPFLACFDGDGPPPM